MRTKPNIGMHPTRMSGAFMRETLAMRRFARAGDAERYALTLLWKDKIL